MTIRRRALDRVIIATRQSPNLPKHPRCALIGYSEGANFMTQFEYKGFRMTIKEVGPGWRIEVVHREGGQPRETATHRELSEAIDEAKEIVYRPA